MLFMYISVKKKKKKKNQTSAINDKIRDTWMILA
jgi:hypothetical protein